MCVYEYLISDLEAGLQQYRRKSGVNFCRQPETEARFRMQHIQLLRKIKSAHIRHMVYN